MAQADSARGTARRSSQGVIIAHLTAGMSVGKPLAEPAHITPRFPRGITNSDLQHAEAAIQRETALYWFHLNLEPYDLSKGGPYFGFSGAIGGAPIGALPIGGGPNIAGFDRGSFAPSPVEARVILQEEFAGVLRDEVTEELGNALAGKWMWKNLPVQPSSIVPATAAEALTALVPVLDALAGALQGVELPASEHGGIGHNRPPGEVAFTEEDRRAVLEKIEETKQAVQSDAADAPSRVGSIWSAISPKLLTFGQWAVNRANDFFVEASREAGKSAGKWVIPAAIAYSLGQHASIISLFHQAGALVEALDHLSLH